MQNLSPVSLLVLPAPVACRSSSSFPSTSTSTSTALLLAILLVAGVPLQQAEAQEAVDTSARTLNSHGQQAERKPVASLKTTSSTAKMGSTSVGCRNRTSTQQRAPQRSRLFSTSTARPVGNGAFYASLAPLALQAGVGISNALSVRAATALGFDGEDPEYALRTTPKLTVRRPQSGAPSESAALSVALDARTTARYQTYPDGREWTFATLPRVVATYGTPKAALTAAAGVPLTTSDGSGLLAATLGGEVQVLNWLKLLSENHLYVDASQRYDLLLSGGGGARLLPEETTFASLSGGARFMWDRFSFETGLVGRTGADFDEDVGVHLRLSYRF